MFKFLFLIREVVAKCKEEEEEEKEEEEKMCLGWEDKLNDSNGMSGVEEIELEGCSESFFTNSNKGWNLQFNVEEGEEEKVEDG